MRRAVSATLMPPVRNCLRLQQPLASQPLHGPHALLVAAALGELAGAQARNRREVGDAQGLVPARLCPRGKGRPVDGAPAAVRNLRAPGLQQQRRCVMQRGRGWRSLRHAQREEARQRQELRRHRRASRALGPQVLGGVEHEASAAGARFEVVALAGRYHPALAGADAPAAAFDLQFQHAVESDQHLEVLMRMAAARGAVAPQRKRVRRGREVAVGCRRHCPCPARPCQPIWQRRFSRWPAAAPAGPPA